jgi:hypothetical protein
MARSLLLAAVHSFSNCSCFISLMPVAKNATDLLKQAEDGIASAQLALAKKLAGQGEMKAAWGWYVCICLGCLLDRFA